MTTTTEKSAHLWSTKGGADKLYNLFLRPKADGWAVDYTNGKRGGTMASGTKTEKPVSYEAALKLFESTVRAKTKDGYGPASTGQAYTSSEFAGRATGLDLQLLTSIDESYCNSLLRDDGWCAQLKENGERRPLFVKDGVVTGGNRSGLLVDIPAAWLTEFAQFGNATFDGEHVGEAYAAFDLLSHNGEDLTGFPFAARYMRLVNLLESQSVLPPSLRLVEAQATTSTKERLLQYVRDNQLEGVAFKRLSGIYEAGRSDDALKFKLTESATCIVVRQNTQRSIVLGLLNADGQLVEQGNVTIPANHRMPEPEALVEVEFLYYTGKAFEQPVYGGERTDLTRADARIDQITRHKPTVTPGNACAQALG
jgi:bifunctional non-homologous end joining protein LigD